MTLLLTIILIMTILLLLVGSMSKALGLVLIVICVGALAYLAYKTLAVHYYAYKKLQKLGGNWAGYMRYISGISGRMADSCFLFLTNDKNLVIDDKQHQTAITYAELVNVGVIEASLLAQINDREIAELMGMKSHPALHAMRSWLSRHPEAKRHFVMMLYLDREVDGTAQKGELVFFSDVERKGHIRELLRQPEIAVKALFIPRGTTVEELYPSQDRVPKKKKIYSYDKGEEQIAADKIEEDSLTEPFPPLT